jgi:hypothetical protein
MEFSSTVDRGAPAITQPNASLFPAPESAFSLKPCVLLGLGFYDWANVQVLSTAPHRFVFVFEIKYPKTIPPKYYLIFRFL